MHTLKATKTAKLKTKPRDPFTRGLSTRLKEARLAVRPKLSQEEVGGLFEPKISRAAVSQWEDAIKGTTPDLDKLVTLSRAYGVSLDWLLAGEAAAPPAKAAEGRAPYASNGLSAEAVEIGRLWASLPSVKQRMFKDAIEWDAAILEAFPAMKQALVVLNPNYHNMTERFSKDELVRQIQLNLPL